MGTSTTCPPLDLVQILPPISLNSPLSLRITITIISYIVTMQVHLQLQLFHFAMSTSKPGPSEPLLQQQFRTTIDVECLTWSDRFMSFSSSKLLINVSRDATA
jgi:hypothetical protein